MPDINWLAALVAAIAAFAAGSLWYSPLLFSKVWQKEVGISEAAVQNASMARTMGLAFALMFLAAIAVALFIGRNASFGYGLSYGFHVGVFFVATMTGVHYLFEQRSFKLWLINAGYGTIVFMIIGAVVGAFP